MYLFSPLFLSELFYLILNKFSRVFYLGQKEVETGLNVGDHGRVTFRLSVDVGHFLLSHGLDDLAEDGPVAHLCLQVLDASSSFSFLYRQY
jgi:hypothetical protein